ncbi:serine/Arginine-related protein 53-like isoform X2 [Periplaneta americana]
MSRYSSESDSSRGDDHSQRRSISNKMRGRSRSSSGSSSDSHYSYKRKSYKHKRSKGHRSRSRDRHSKSSHRSRHYNKTSDSSHSLRSRSSSKGRSRRSSRDRSRDRSRSGDKHSRGHTRSRSRSKERSRRRSRSRSRSKERSRYRSRSVSKNKSNSPVILKQEPSTEEQLRAKLQRAIKAAQSADDQLRQQGLLTGGSIRKEDLHREPVIPMYPGNVLDEINDSSFVQKRFVSSKSIGNQVSTDTPIIDLTEDSVPTVHTVPQVVEDPESIFHTSLSVDPQAKLDKWVKKLFHMRQKAINGEPLA